MPSRSHAPSILSSKQRPRWVFLAGTSLTFLKPIFKRTLRPLAAQLAQAGVTANQVTLVSLIGSIAVSVLLCVYSDYTAMFAILPIWLLVRMACATIDGTLAINFGQKSRLGGILNEAGDIISDAAIFLPLASVSSLSIAPIICLVGLATYAEIVGILSESMGCGRRLEGPLGKADRTIVLAIIAVTVASLGRLPGGFSVVFPVFSVGLVLTVWNRTQCAFGNRRGNDAR